MGVYESLKKGIGTNVALVVTAASLSAPSAQLNAAEAPSALRPPTTPPVAGRVEAVRVNQGLEAPKVDYRGVASGIYSRPKEVGAANQVRRVEDKVQIEMGKYANATSALRAPTVTELTTAEKVDAALEHLGALGRQQYGFSGGLEASKQRLATDTGRNRTADQVRDIPRTANRVARHTQLQQMYGAQLDAQSAELINLIHAQTPEVKQQLLNQMLSDKNVANLLFAPPNVAEAIVYAFVGDPAVDLIGRASSAFVQSVYAPVQNDARTAAQKSKQATAAMAGVVESGLGTLSQEDQALFAKTFDLASQTGIILVNLNYSHSATKGNGQIRTVTRNTPITLIASQYINPADYSQRVTETVAIPLDQRQVLGRKRYDLGIREEQRQAQGR